MKNGTEHGFPCSVCVVTACDLANSPTFVSLEIFCRIMYDDKYSYVINGNISKKEMVEIAESLVKK